MLLLGAALVSQYGLGIQLPYMPSVEISWVHTYEQPPNIHGWLDENLLQNLNDCKSGECSKTPRVIEL